MDVFYNTRDKKIYTGYLMKYRLAISSERFVFSIACRKYYIKCTTYVTRFSHFLWVCTIGVDWVRSKIPSLFTAKIATRHKLHHRHTPAQKLISKPHLLINGRRGTTQARCGGKGCLLQYAPSGKTLIRWCNIMSTWWTDLATRGDLRRERVCSSVHTCRTAGSGQYEARSITCSSYHGYVT